MLLRVLKFALLCWFFIANSGVIAQPPEGGKDASSKAVVFFENYCKGCHNEDEAMSGIRVDHVSEIDSFLENRRSWKRVVEVLRFGSMPPQDAEQPPAKELRQIQKKPDSSQRQMAEELQDVKLQVGLLQQEVETRGRQIDALLTKLDSTADRIVELTVEIRSLNSRQERHSKVDDEIRSELKLLHTRVGTVHDEIGNSERRVSAQIDKLEERLRSVEQWKSRLMGMTTLVAGAIGAIAASIVTWMAK